MKRLGNFFIYTTDNNTIMTLTGGDPSLSLLTLSAGQFSLNDRTKASNYHFISLIDKILERIRSEGITHLNYFVRGKGGNYSPRPGPGLYFALKKLREVPDISLFGPITHTPTPFGGTRKPGGRRGKRK